MVKDDSRAARPVRITSPITRSVSPAAWAMVSATRPICAARDFGTRLGRHLTARLMMSTAGRPLKRAVMDIVMVSENEDRIAEPICVEIR